MDTDIRLPQEFEYLKPYIPLMKNAVNGVDIGVNYSLLDLLKLAKDKNIIVGDSEDLELPRKAIVMLPATNYLPAGKYMDLAPIREAANQLPHIRLQEIIMFVYEYPFESDVYDKELIELIANHFSNDNNK